MLHHHHQERDMDGHSARSSDDRLPMSSFLHTIPEGSSDVGGAAAASPFNPEAAAAVADEEAGRSNLSGGGSDNNTSAWTAMMRPFRSSQLQNHPRPPAPGSVASSTRAVEAGNAGVDEKSMMGSEAGNVGGPASGMDGSLTAVAGLGEDTDTLEQADLHYHHPPRPGGVPIKRRRSSLARANKRKVGVVCFSACLVVFIVIIALIVIVKKLDHDDDDDSEANVNNSSSANAELLNGTNSSTNETDLEESTIAPTVAESTYGFGFVSASGTSTGTGTGTGTDNPSSMNDDDLPFFDDAVDDTLTEEQSLLVQLDEAIYMLYTAEETAMNMLPHVSSEVFSNGLSARYQAREWLLNNDTLLQSTIMDSTASSSTTTQPMDTLDRIAQRYIMLVFYFSTLNNDSAASSATTALVQDTTNTMEASAMATTSANGQNRRTLQQQHGTKFQIHPDVHECFWISNACGQDGTNNNNVQVQSTATVTTSSSSTTTQLNSEYILYLNVSHANLKGTLPFELGYLSGLRELAIHGNELTGSIPELLLTQLQYLYVLDLSQNSFQGTIPPALWSLPTLRFAYLHGNKLTGTIPQTLPASPSSDLEEIWLRDNKLSGSIPQWWTELPNLDVLSVRNNSWTGALPQQWSQASKLEFLDVSYNQLTGNIPPSLLYGIPALQHLYLDFNQLVGTLPTVDSAIEMDMAVTVTRSAELKMQALWLQYNQLTGTIPSGFGWEWPKLQELELFGNQFTGEWDCLGKDDKSDDVWPQLQELAIDCASESSSSSSSSVVSVSSMEQAKVNLTQQPTTGSGSDSGSGGGGVDMSSCKACCIKCFY